jgi:hypothetical protein
VTTRVRFLRGDFLSEKQFTLLTVDAEQAGFLFWIGLSEKRLSFLTVQLAPLIFNLEWFVRKTAQFFDS